MVPDLEDISLKIRSAIGNTVFGIGMGITHEQEGNAYRQVILRTMEFWLMSSDKVAVGLRTEMVRPGFDRVLWWGIKVTRGNLGIGKSCV